MMAVVSSIAAGVIVYCVARAILERRSKASAVNATPAVVASYYEAQSALRARHNKAWDFWKWANSVYVQNLKNNPPADTYRLTRAHDGRWIAEEYDGVKVWSLSYRWMSGISMSPPEGPDGEHHWRVIGEQAGFLYREDAERFLSAHIADKTTSYSFTNSGATAPTRTPQSESDRSREDN